MSEPKQSYIFKTETTSGTQKDLTSFVSSVEIEPENTEVPLCYICGKPATGAVMTFGEGTNINKILTDKDAQSVMYYCAGHEPYFETIST